MDRIDKLILDYLFDLRVKVSSLITPEIELNKPAHGLSKHELFSRLVDLYDSGLICFYKNHEQIITPLPHEPLLQESWYVSLTDTGASRWEEVFKPNWSKYLSIDIIPSNTGHRDQVTLKSGSNEILHDVVMGCDAEEVGEVLEISPWNPTYWKSCENGFSLELVISEESLEEVIDNASKIVWKLDYDEIDKKKSGPE